MSENVTPEALVMAVEAELAELDKSDVQDRDLIASMRKDIASRKDRRAELRRMLPRAPRKAKATD